MEYPNKLKNFIFISKTIFLPKKGILVVGDLHLGYDQMMKEQGINLSFSQLEETKKEIETIIKKIKTIYKLNKIILLGDMKHHFKFQKQEVSDLENFLKFLEKHVDKKNIILIKGNHDTFTIKDYNLKELYIEEDIAFTHGEKDFIELYNKKIKTIIISHLHPALSIKDKANIKREKYKCFLVGKYKKKQFIVVPSFFSIIEGTEISEYSKNEKYQQIIPKNKLSSFEAYVVGKDKIYYFGKYGKLRS